MQRAGGLWSKLISFNNLFRAYRKARLGKGRTSAIAHFALELEPELLSLQRELGRGDYRPGDYRLFTIYERKPRRIAAAPFRDRVVHHAIMNVIEPPIDRAFIHDSYACRGGKGVHAAVDRYQYWACRYSYVLKLDIARYFPSIDHEILKRKLRRYIKDHRVLRLLDLIIDGSPDEPGMLTYFAGDDLLTPLARRVGIPIGNLTSQFFANLFLNDLDHFVKQQLGCRAYLRYVDDMVVLGNDKRRLWTIRGRVEEHLAHARLRLHPNKVHVTRTIHGVDLLGYRVFPDFRRLRDDNGHRFARKLRKFASGYAKGRILWEDIDPVVQSWIGHAAHADTSGLRARIFSQTIFRRGTGREAPGA